MEPTLVGVKFEKLSYTERSESVRYKPLEISIDRLDCEVSLIHNLN